MPLAVASMEPAKEAEPVPAKIGLPVLIVKPVPTMAAAFKPLVIASEPEKELEEVAPVWVKAPEMEAAPPTSNIVSTLTPELMPNLLLVESHLN